MNVQSPASSQTSPSKRSVQSSAAGSPTPGGMREPHEASVDRAIARAAVGASPTTCAQVAVAPSVIGVALAEASTPPV